MDQLAAAAQNTGQFLTNTALPRVEQGAGLGLDLIETLRSLEQPGGFMRLQAQKAEALQDPTQRMAIQGSPFLAGTYGLGLGPNLPPGSSAETARAGGQIPGVQMLGPGEQPTGQTMPGIGGGQLVPQLPQLAAGGQAQQALATAMDQAITADPMGAAKHKLGLPSLNAADVVAMTPGLMAIQQHFPGSRFTYDQNGHLHVSVGGTSAPLEFSSPEKAVDALRGAKGYDVLSTNRGTYVVRRAAQSGLPEDVTLPTGGATPAAAPGAQPDAAPAPAATSDDEGPVEGLPPSAMPVSPTGQIGAPQPQQAPAPQQAAQPAPAPETAKIGFPSQAFNDPGGIVQNRQTIAQATAPLGPTGQATPGVSRGTTPPTAKPEQPDAIQAMPLNVKSMTLKSKTRNVTLAPPKLTAQQVTEAENVKQIKSAIRETLQLLNQGSPRDFTVPGIGTIPKGGQTTGMVTSNAISLAGKLRDPLFSPGGKVPMDPLQVRQTLLESGFRRMFDVAFIFAGKRLTNQEIERMFRPLVPESDQADDIIRSKMLGINDILQNIDSERNKLLQLDPGEDKEGTFEQSPRGKALYTDVYGAQARRFLLLQQVPPPKRLDQQPQP